MLDKITIIQKRLLTVSNTIAKNPPTGLKKYDWQALVILSTVIDEKEKPIFGIDDIQQIIEKQGIKDKAEQHRFLEDFMLQQDTFVLSFEEFFSYYNEQDGLNRTVKKDILKAVEGLHNRRLYTNNKDDVFRGITWFDTVEVNYKEKYIMFILGRIAKRLLMGLDKNFLQMMATSVTEFSGKHSTPIFMYMKSKIHKGTDAFSWTETLPEFQHRFGHDQVASYTKDFNSYYKRVLQIAEKDSLNSGDIAFKFQGKAERGRKISHIHCKVWRTGNIHLPYAKGGEQKALFDAERRKRWAGIEEKMTTKQQVAYEFLKSVEINFGFLLDEVFTHPCTKQEVIIGYEDVFFRMLWNRFLTYTKASKKAGAFVSWWRKGRLTEGNHYWATIETLSKHKNKVPSKEADIRAEMARYSHGNYKQKMLDKATNAKSNKSSAPKVEVPQIAKTIPTKRTTFDIQKFQIQFPEVYEQIKEDLSEQLRQIYLGSVNKSDLTVAQNREIAQKVEQMLPHRCLVWEQKQAKG